MFTFTEIQLCQVIISSIFVRARKKLEKQLEIPQSYFGRKMKVLSYLIPASFVPYIVLTYIYDMLTVLKIKLRNKDNKRY